VKTST